MPEQEIQTPAPLRELQQAQLHILREIDAFCRAHEIPYFLGEGTLLGAVRHQGFIPWDDDLDLLMKRADYERFLALAQEKFPAGYAMQHATTVAGYWSPILKVRRITGTFPPHLRQQHIAHLTDDNGPYVDIFPMEYLPKQDSVTQRIQSTKLRMLRGMLSLKCGLFPPQSLAGRILKVASRFCSVPWLHRRLEHTVKTFGATPRPFIGTLSSYHPYRCQIVPAEVYAQTKMVSFEGGSYPIPAGYDCLLRTIYGDYMTLPPPEERVAKHYFSDES